MRSYKSPIPHIPRTHTGYQFPRGTTAFLAEAKKTFKNNIEVVPIATPDAAPGAAMADA